MFEVGHMYMYGGCREIRDVMTFSRLHGRSSTKLTCLTYLHGRFRNRGIEPFGAGHLNGSLGSALV